MEDADGERVTAGVVRRRCDPRKQHQIPGTGHAARAGSLEKRVRLVQRPEGGLVCGALPVERRGGLPAHRSAMMVEEVLADGKVGYRLDSESAQISHRANAATHQDCRCEIRAGGEHHFGRLDTFPVRRLHADTTPSVEQQAIDERVAAYGEVGTTPRRLEVGECGAPAHPAEHICGQPCHAYRLGGVVRRVEQLEPGLSRRLDERVVRRCWAIGVRPGRAQAGRGPFEVRRERRERPFTAPLVVVRRCAPDHHARVMRGAAAYDPRAQRAGVLAAHAPVVTEREGAWIEDVRRPATLGPQAVVLPGLEEAHGPLRTPRTAVLRARSRPCQRPPRPRRIPCAAEDTTQLIKRPRPRHIGESPSDEPRILIGRCCRHRASSGAVTIEALRTRSGDIDKRRKAHAAQRLPAGTVFDQHAGTSQTFARSTSTARSSRHPRSRTRRV